MNIGKYVVRTVSNFRVINRRHSSLFLNFIGKPCLLVPFNNNYCKLFITNYSQKRFYCSQPKENDYKQSSIPLGKLEGKYLISYTCNVCDHRSQKIISKQAYAHGVVIVKCDQCENNHLIADNLGWFYDEKRNIEDILKEKGETVAKVTSTDDFQVVPKG